MEVRAGTSGWEYPDWKEFFYPPGIKARERLRYYATIFNSVEVNSTFYRDVRPSTVRRWLEAIADLPFVFVCKLHRQFTHLWKLRVEEHGDEAEQKIKKWWSSLSALGTRLEALLIQLPPSLSYDEGLWKTFVAFLRENVGKRVLLFVEARHSTWLTPSVYEKIRRSGAHWVVSHSSRWNHWLPPSDSIIYFRFHGPRELFRSSYSEEDLKQWASKIEKIEPERLYIYFNNTFRANAVKNAQMILRLLKP